MKKLLILLAASALIIPTMVLAGNTAPTVYFEVYYQPCDPTDPDCPGAPEPPMGLPANACVHQSRTYPVTLPCYAPRLAGNFYIIPIHIGKLNEPICPVPGAGCTSFGGYLGIFFGAQTVGGTGPTFMSWTACPGFLKGPSTAGEPAACGASSTKDCHDWYDHEGYLTYLNLSGTTQRNINIVNNADLGHTKVINCHNMYDEGTVIGTGVQIGGAQTIVCPESPTAVQNTTWGAIKGLYR